MAPLNVRSPVPPPTLTGACDGIARPPIDARDARDAAPAHVCQQEHSQPMNMSHHGLTGSHSSPRSQGSRGPDRHAQSRGTHAAGTLGSRARSQQRTSRSRRRCRTAWVTQGGNEPPTTQQAGWPPTREESELWSGSAQCDLGVMQCAYSVQVEIVPCARTLPRTQSGPCHDT